MTNDEVSQAYQEIKSLTHTIHVYQARISFLKKQIDLAKGGVSTDVFVTQIQSLGLPKPNISGNLFTWAYCYVVNNVGIILAKASFLEDKLWNVKWYVDDKKRGELLPIEITQYAYYALCECGRVPTDEELEKAIQRSLDKQEKKYQSNLKWREEHPPKNEGKTRKALTKPNVRRELHAELVAVMKES